MHLSLVDDKIGGSAAAFELLVAALLGAELFVFALAQGEEGGGEATVARGARQGGQRVFLWGGTEERFSHSQDHGRGP